jgi:hypothetical protein
MHNLALIVALVEARRRQCPCGAVAERPDGLCRKCQARVAWRRKVIRTPRRANRRHTRHVRDVADQVADSMSRRRASSKEVES